MALTYPVPLNVEVAEALGTMTEREAEEYLKSPEATDYREATERAKRIADLPDMERDIRWLLRNFDRWMTKGQWKKLDSMKKKYERKKTRC